MATVGLIPGIAIALERLGLESELATTTASAATPSLTSALTLLWIRTREGRETKNKRIDEARLGMLAGEALPTMIGVGLAAGGLVSAFQALLFLMVERTLKGGSGSAFWPWSNRSIHFFDTSTTFRRGSGFRPASRSLSRSVFLPTIAPASGPS